MKLRNLFRGPWVVRDDDAPLSNLDVRDGLTDPRRADYINRYGITGDVYDRLTSEGAIR